VKEEDKQTVSRLNFWFIGQILFFVLNFINAIIQTIAGYSGIRILCSIFWYALIVGLTGYGFYYAFRAYCGDKTSNAMLKFKASWGLIFILLIFQFIADRINWNGIVRWVRLFKDGNGFAGVMSLIEWILMGINIGALVYLVL
jgi:hypothetical protein